MCLFSSDLYTGCEHVECNLIRAIQLQNSHRFSQLKINQNLRSKMSNIQFQSNNQPQISSNSQSIDQSYGFARNNENPKQNKSQAEVKNQLNRSEKTFLNTYPPGCTINMIQKSYEQASVEKSQNNTRNVSQPNKRIIKLQQQVNTLQMTMRTLLLGLRQKHILSDQEYKAQWQFLEQLQNTAITLKTKENNN